jgi:AAA+ superfamily predicted ATPase
LITDIWNRIRQLYEAEVAHQFLLHLNVRDLVAHPIFGYVPLSDYLFWNISQLGDPDTNWLVFSFDRSAGAQFPEDLRVRGGARAGYQWRFGLNATLYKFAQSSAIAGNERAALAALATLVDLHPDFVPCIRDDAKPERPFATFAENPAFQSLLNKGSQTHWKHLNPGIRTAASGMKRDNPLSDVLNRFDGLLHGNPYGRRVGVIVERVEMLAPNRHRSRRNENIGYTETILVTETLARWAWDRGIRMSRNLLILTTQNLAEVAPELVSSRELVVIEVPFPEIQERRAFLRHLFVMPEHWQPPPEPKEGEEPVKEWPPFRQRTQYPDTLRYSEGFNQRDAAQLTAGLTLTSLYDVFLPIALRSQALQREHLFERKAREVSDFSRGLLELVPSDVPLEHIGGLNHVGRYFTEVIPRLLERDLKSVPNGVWLFGPPGTGKSLTVRALARSTIAPVLRLRMPHELGVRAVEPGLTSEDDYANDLALALAYARSIGPTVIFVDRVDETFRAGRWSQERIVTSRALGMILDWMARPDTRGDILWVAASARPHFIEPRLVTTPLMDTLVYFLPTPTERADILRKVLLHYAVPTAGELPYEEIARQPAAENLTGEDVATIAVRAHRRARAQGRAAVSRDDLLAVLNDFASESTPRMIERLSLEAARFASARSQLPDTVLPPLAATVLDNSRIAKERIENRLRELAAMMPETI